MASIPAPFKEFSESKKDRAWFSRILNDVVARKQWLVSKPRYDINLSFYEATYSIERTKRKFDVFNTPENEQFIDFSQLDLLSSRVNSIVSILEKMSFEVKANCTDPTARSKRDQDVELLKAEKALTPIRKQFSQALGMKEPLPIASPEDFSSDISPIAKNNLDISNPVDEGIFKDYLQRQVWEIAIEIGVQHYLNTGKYNEKFKRIVTDLINHNCCATQVTTNSYSGEPEQLYLYPFNVYTVLANDVSGDDALGKGWEQPLSVRDIIGILGQSITSDDLLQILSLANEGGNTNYEGIWMYGSRVDYSDGFSYPFGVSQSKCCEWQAFLNMRATLGYLEIKSQNSDLYIHRKENGNLVTAKYGYDYKPPVNIKKVEAIDELKKDSDRFLEYKFYDVTYCGYYLPNTNYVFGFKKLPLAVRYGTTNELTDFSIVTQKLKGKSMNEKCQPYIRHIFDLWCKLQHWLNESRASGEMWNIETVRQMARDIIGVDGKEGKLLDTLKILINNTNGIYVPQTIGGEQTGGDSMPVKWQVRGIDPTAIQLDDFITRDKNRIVEITGVSDVLLATQQVNRDAGLGVSQIALQQSLNTIYYLQSSVQKVFSDVSFNLSQKVQWIAGGEVSVEAYKSLVKAIGERNVESLKLLGKNPPYSFSIGILWGMNELEQQKMDARVEQMLATKAITASQAFTIQGIKNFKLAGALLSLFENKNIQAAQQQQLALVQAESAKSAQTHAETMEEIREKNKGMTDVALINKSAIIERENIQAGNKIAITDKKEIGKHISTDAKFQQNIEQMMLESELEKQNAPPQTP